jgi:DNA (cytosine-5)-methyltransferase 1
MNTTTKKRLDKEKRAPAPVANASVVDLFCGAGGLSYGFKQEGFEIAAGFDIDESCRFPFEANNKAPFIREDISRASAKAIAERFKPKAARVLVGCAPCQPFSTYNQKNSDPKWKLVNRFSDLIEEIGPDVVSMENVPTLLKFGEGKVFRRFVNRLCADGYDVWWDVAFAPAYGVPQVRKRLVLLASRLGPIELEAPSFTEDDYPTVRSAIGALPRLRAGATDKRDPLHRSSGMSDLNLARVRNSRPGGTWRDWSPKMVAACHRKDTGRGYSSVYGRMGWDEPSPTITTQFFGFGNGRFGHPTQNRALSLREGAILQSFPRNYRFVPPGEDPMFKSLGRMIGNAVPVGLARAIARSVRAHLDEHKS